MATNKQYPFLRCVLIFPKKKINKKGKENPPLVLPKQISGTACKLGAYTRGNVFSRYSIFRLRNFSFAKCSPLHIYLSCTADIIFFRTKSKNKEFNYQSVGGLSLMISRMIVANSLSVTGNLRLFYLRWEKKITWIRLRRNYIG